MDYRIKEVEENVELSIVIPIPKEDLHYSFSISKSYGNNDDNVVVIRDKEQFNRIKESFGGTHFDQKEFWVKTKLLYCYLNRLKSLGILEDYIDCNIDKNGYPIKYPDLSMDFISCSAVYIDEEGIQRDGLYFFPKLNDWYTDTALEYIKNKYKDSFFRILPLDRFINGNINCDYILFCFKVLNIEKRKEHYTYVMSDDNGYYKIGRSIYPERRESVLSTGNPTLKLLFFINGNREKELHDHFANKRVKGEWYNLNKNDLKYIKNYNNIRKNRNLIENAGK